MRFYKACTVFGAGSRASGVKNGPLFFGKLQIASTTPRYTNWQADLWVGQVNIVLLMIFVIYKSTHRLQGWWAPRNNQYIPNMHRSLIPYLGTYLDRGIVDYKLSRFLPYRNWVLGLAGSKLPKQSKWLRPTLSAYFIIHVQHQMCADQISICRNQENLYMYLYKLWTWDFIEHVRILHSILCHFLDRRFSG